VANLPVLGSRSRRSDSRPPPVPCGAGRTTRAACQASEVWPDKALRWPLRRWSRTVRPAWFLVVMISKSLGPRRRRRSIKPETAPPNVRNLPSGPVRALVWEVPET